MDRMLYVALGGARQTLRAQAVVANNLANVSTPGFKAEMQRIVDLPLQGPGYPSRVYARDQGLGADFSPGARMATGRDLDVMIDGDGFIAVQAPDGTEAYTRAGNLRVTANGQLLTGAGYPVLGNGGPIALPPFEKLEVGADGTVSIRPVGQEATTLAVVDRIKLVRPEAAGLSRTAEGLFSPMDGSVAPADAEVRLVAGALEGSNVNAVGALVDMIEISRRFEMQVKMLKAAEDNDAAATQLLRLG